MTSTVPAPKPHPLVIEKVENGWVVKRGDKQWVATSPHSLGMLIADLVNPALVRPNTAPTNPPVEANP